LSCAKAAGTNLPLHYRESIWIMDFPNNTIRKFHVMREDTTLSPVPALEKDQEQVNQTAVTAYEVELTSQERQMVEGAVAFVNGWLRPAGADLTMQFCSVSPHASGKALASEGGIIIGSDNPSIDVSVFNLPSSVAPSAFDVIGNHARGVEIGRFINEQRPVVSNMKAVIDLVDKATNTIYNIKPAWLVKFSDGSSGMWEFDTLRTRLKADFSTFEDSEHNPIPLKLNDTAGRTFRFTGGPGENPNIGNMASRIELIGGSISGGLPGSGCISTTFTCGSNACPVTCLTN